MKPLTLTAALCAGLATTTLATTPTFSATEQPEIMIIMDSSGSMRKKIGGMTKMDIAKRAVSDFVATAPKDIPIGLMAYGHRRAKDCTDIQVVLAPEEGSGRSIEQAVFGMRPKGETPIADSLRAAADYMNSQTKTATVVLVTDGEEACNADPCAAAAELEASGVDFTAHVVGFGLNEEQSKAVKCLADNTGGQFIAANNTAELAGALVKTVVKAPPPAPVKVSSAANVVWEDNFDGGALGEVWTVRNADADNFVVDGGELIAINQSANGGPTKGDAPNHFLANVDLPSGDWDLSVTARFEFSTSRDGFFLGLSDDKGNSVIGAMYTSQNCRGFQMKLYTLQYAAYKERARAEKHHVGKCTDAKLKPYRKVSDEFAKRSTTLTFHKRGRKYFTSIDGGPLNAADETETLTILRAPKTITMGVHKYRQASADTVVNIDNIRLVSVD
ncbi:MAG: VWA domain-containing protein [Pseudomonadota bacterium]